jgi:hypothetical protein
VTAEVLIRWIEDLHVRVERGELDRLGPIDVGYGPLPAVLTTRLLLADYDDLEDLPTGVLESAEVAARRRELAGDFGRLLWELALLEVPSA